MPPTKNYRGIADPLDMATIENNDYALYGWYDLRPNANQL
jgi:hypothetical protein